MPRKDWYGSQSQPVQLAGQRCDQKVREDACGEKGGPCKGPKRAAWCWLVWQYDWCRVRFGHLMSFHVLCDRQEKEQRDNEERARRRKVIEVRVELCRLKIVDPTWFSILTYAYLGKEKDRKRRCKAPRRREGHGTRSTAAMTSLPLDAHSAWELIFTIACAATNVPNPGRLRSIFWLQEMKSYAALQNLDKTTNVGESLKNAHIGWPWYSWCTF